MWGREAREPLLDGPLIAILLLRAILMAPQKVTWVTWDTWSHLRYLKVCFRDIAFLLHSHAWDTVGSTYVHMWWCAVFYTFHTLSFQLLSKRKRVHCASVFLVGTMMLLPCTIHTVSVWYKQLSVGGANVMRDKRFFFFLSTATYRTMGQLWIKQESANSAKKYFWQKKPSRKSDKEKNKEKTTTTMTSSFPLENLRCLSSKTKVTIKASSSDLGHYKRLSRYPQVTINGRRKPGHVSIGDFKRGLLLLLWFFYNLWISALDTLPTTRDAKSSERKNAKVWFKKCQPVNREAWKSAKWPESWHFFIFFHFY